MVVLIQSVEGQTRTRLSSHQQEVPSDSICNTSYFLSPACQSPCTLAGLHNHMSQCLKILFRHICVYVHTPDPYHTMCLWRILTYPTDHFVPLLCAHPHPFTQSEPAFTPKCLPRLLWRTIPAQLIRTRVLACAGS